MTARKPKPAPPKRAAVRTEKGKSGLTPTFPDRPIGKGNPPRETQIKPGQVLNPGGRPALLSGAYKAMLAAVDPRDPEGRTNAELIAIAARSQALQGEVPAMREIRSATEGDKITVEDVTGKADAELIAELAALMDAARARAGVDAGGGTEAPGPDGGGTTD